MTTTETPATQTDDVNVQAALVEGQTPKKKRPRGRPKKEQNYPSEVMGPMGTPAVVYQTEEARERGDKIYRCRVINAHLGLDTGRDSVTVNGHKTRFELGADIELRGFEIDQFRQCKYRAPKITQAADGHIKISGWENRNVYAVDVQW